MAKITKVMVGESLVGDGNEVAHIDLIVGPRGSAAETAFTHALTNNKDGFTSLLAVIAPNLATKPHTILFNKVTIKGAKQAVQMFGPAQAAVATSGSRLLSRGNDSSRRSQRRVHLRRRVHPLGCGGRSEDLRLQLQGHQGIARTRYPRRPATGGGHRQAQLGQASVLAEVTACCRECPSAAQEACERAAIHGAVVDRGRHQHCVNAHGCQGLEVVGVACATGRDHLFAGRLRLDRA